MSYELRKLPSDHVRVETGPLQIGNDWPGVFIRGDNALMGYAPALRTLVNALLQQPSGLPVAISIAQAQDLIGLLESCLLTPPEQT